MPERLLVPEPAGPGHDDQEQQPGRREALDLTALRRALRESRTDVEDLDFTTERLRYLEEAFTAGPTPSRSPPVRPGPTPRGFGREGGRLP
ncbi:hypothetical protein ACFY8B_33125 [Streptomyces sp. NPDC012751]|uniref:hypothetical protein n=1 Tax=Streptomyces sp. NPDC012751 TaxID=3364846 RepID=UPI0036787A83